MKQMFLKRMFDFCLSLMVFCFLLPLFVLMTVLLFVANSGSPFFVQKRPGKDGKAFSIIKFKTMNDRQDQQGRLLPDAERLTKLGKFVRTTSIDEIPQLLNVLKGEMSLVGPRPLLMEYLPLYNSEQYRRHEVKPGITGWAQVNGRNAISWQDKFKLDVWYVDNQSFGLDMKILFLTVKKVLIKDGISSEGEATTSQFTGNHDD